MKFSIEMAFKPQDIWIGVYWKFQRRLVDNLELENSQLSIFVCILPMLPIRFWFQFAPKKKKEREHLTTISTDPRLTRGVDDVPTPQADVYLVLSEEERKRGFIRPYRDSYRHAGSSPKYPLRDLTDEEKQRYEDMNYEKFEIYPESMLPKTGKFWTQKQLNLRGCGTVTTMGRELSETYARNPHFYGATYCAGCHMHRPVEEFVWTTDGKVVGS